MSRNLYRMHRGPNTEHIHMKKNLALFLACMMVTAITAGCVATNEDLRSALNRDTQAVSNLAREQAALIAAKSSPEEVNNKVTLAEPYLNNLRTLCANPANSESTGESSCTFYKGLSSKFTADMLLASSMYYLKNNDLKKAERNLHELIDTYNEAQYQAEVGQAKIVLEYIKNWDHLGPGMKAFILGDYETALQELRTKDDPESLYTVGMIYYNGSGVPRDSTKAAEWYRKAADKGYPPAQYQLGLLYLSGEGVEHDETEAIKWFKKASDQDYSKALDMLRSIRSK